MDWADGLFCSLQERCVAALARVERTDFLSPMCIGEVAHVSAEITYTSKHSVEVQVHVMSENILTGNSQVVLTRPACSAPALLSKDHNAVLWFTFCCCGETRTETNLGKKGFVCFGLEATAITGKPY